MKWCLFGVALAGAFLGGVFWQNSKNVGQDQIRSVSTSDPVGILEEKPFVIIIPSYNNSLWVEKNLRSVFEQKYERYRVIYIDDASIDSTLVQVNALVDQLGQLNRVSIVKNASNLGAMANIYYAVHQCSPHEIILVLDGDDWFAHDQVLNVLNQTYADQNVWLTWGSYVEYPYYNTYHVANFSRAIPQSVIDQHNVRKYSKKHWCFSQLRTFYAELFHKIKLEDLQFDGSFVDAANDVAFFIPLMEMAGSHVRFLDDILYIWNRATPLNDDKVRGKRQLQIAHYIYAKAPYAPLQSLSTSLNFGEIK